MFQDCCGTLKCLVLYGHLVTMNTKVLWHLKRIVQSLRYEVTVPICIEFFWDIKVVELYRSEYERSTYSLLKSFSEISRLHQVKLGLGRRALRFILSLIVFLDFLFGLLARLLLCSCCGCRSSPFFLILNDLMACLFNLFFLL